MKRAKLFTFVFLLINCTREETMKQRILVVDDEQDILELVEYNLLREGFGITCATNGEDAMKDCPNGIAGS